MYVSPGGVSTGRCLQEASQLVSVRDSVPGGAEIDSGLVACCSLDLRLQLSRSNEVARQTTARAIDGRRKPA